MFRQATFSDLHMEATTFLSSLISTANPTHLFDLRWQQTPSDIKSIVHLGTAWPVSMAIRYTFKLPENASLLVVLTRFQPSYIDHNKPLQELSPPIQAMIKDCLYWWGNTTTLTFIESEQDYDLRFFAFHPSKIKMPQTLGFSDIGTNHYRYKLTSGIGFNHEAITEYERQNLFSSMHELIFHETGHALSLKHPFDAPNPVNVSHMNQTSYTVMAYASEYDPTLDSHLTAATPMPTDMEAIQYLYGQNHQARLGDDTYHLTEVLPNQQGSIASLPWDAGGIDTLSAKGIHQPVRLDLRPYGRSALTHGYVMTPNIELENAIGGSGETTVILNALDNVVDVSDATSTTLVVDPTHCGHDTVIGFQPARDHILLEAPQGNPPNWRLHQTATNSTMIEFSADHSMTLLGINPDDLPNQMISMVNDSVYKTVTQDAKGEHPNLALLSEMRFLPRQLCLDFFDAFSRGCALTLTASLTEVALRRYGCSDEQIYTARYLLNGIYILLCGSLLANTSGHLATALLRQLDFDETLAQLGGAAFTSGLCMAQNMTPVGIAQVTTSIIGSYAGSLFTLWAKSYLQNPDYNKDDRDDSLNMSLG